MSSHTRRPRLRGVLALSTITVGVALAATACEAPQGPSPELVSVRSHDATPRSGAVSGTASTSTTTPVSVAIDVAVVVERGGDQQVRER